MFAPASSHHLIIDALPTLYAANGSLYHVTTVIDLSYYFIRFPTMIRRYRISSPFPR